MSTLSSGPRSRLLWSAAKASELMYHSWYQAHTKPSRWLQILTLSFDQ